MTLLKRGTTSSSVVVSSSVYLCEKCGHVEMSHDIGSSKTCPTCQVPMVLRSSHSGSLEDANTVN